MIEGQRKEEDGDGYVFNPIGYARSCYVHCQGVPRQPGLVPNARSRIEIEEWVPPPAFDDLTQFSHIWVLFVFHMNTNVSTLHRSITEKGFTFPVRFYVFLDSRQRSDHLVLEERVQDCLQHELHIVHVLLVLVW